MKCHHGFFSLELIVFFLSSYIFQLDGHRPPNPITPCGPKTMPAAIRGVNFLSGGQSLEGAAARLNALNKAWGLLKPNSRFLPGKGRKRTTTELLMLVFEDSKLGQMVVSSPCSGK